MARMKSLNTTKLKAELDRVFSLYIRQKNASSSGMVKCYTCNKIGHWKELQNGHFLSRRHLATRWDEDNCKCQCVACNIFGQGKQFEFGERLKKEIGENRVNMLLVKSRQTLKWSAIDYLERIGHYKKFIK